MSTTTSIFLVQYSIFDTLAGGHPDRQSPICIRQSHTTPPYRRPPAAPVPARPAGFRTPSAAYRPRNCSNNRWCLLSLGSTSWPPTHIISTLVRIWRGSPCTRVNTSFHPLRRTCAMERCLDGRLWRHHRLHLRFQPSPSVHLSACRPSVLVSLFP